MTREEAATVIATLAAGFHNETLERETVELWTDELQKLQDATVANQVARRIVRQGDRFPTLHQYRQAYIAAVSPLPELAPKAGPIPEWVSVWWWALCRGETRGFPQQKGFVDERTMMSHADYEVLAAAWRKDGGPGFKLAHVTAPASRPLDEMLAV